VILDLLSREGREAARIRRAAKTLTERYAQPEPRMDAAERLVRIGTPEAIYQLARRFTITSGNLEQDDQEKRWVRDLLVEQGDRAAGPLRRYLKGHDEITWAMDALSTLLTAEELAAFLFEVLQDGDPVAIRGSKAVQVLDFLGGLETDGLAPGVARCLTSSDDTVRIAAVGALRGYADPATREALLEAFVSDEEDSVRVRIAIAELFADLDWEIRGHRPGVERVLPDGFRVSSRGRIVRAG
jgi:HEAT repeat protein